MAKSVKKDGDAPDGHGVSAIRGNGYDPEAVKGFVARLENLNGDIAKEKSAFMLTCKAIHADIKVVLDAAKGTGIPKKELKLAVKRRALLAKVEDIRNDLEGEQQDNYDQILSALGDFAETGLGGAAMERAAA